MQRPKKTDTERLCTVCGGAKTVQRVTKKTSQLKKVKCVACRGTGWAAKGYQTK